MIPLSTSSEDLARGLKASGCRIDGDKIYWEVTIDGPTTHIVNGVVNGVVVSVGFPPFDPRTPLKALAAKLLVIGMGWRR